MEGSAEDLPAEQEKEDEDQDISSERDAVKPTSPTNKHGPDEH